MNWKKKFLEFASLFSKNIKFTSEISDNFLGMKASTGTDSLSTSVFNKPIDSHICFILPLVMKCARVPSHTLRFVTYIGQNDFIDQSSKLFGFFHYHHYLEKKSFRKPSAMSRKWATRQHSKKKKTCDFIQFVLPFHCHGPMTPQSTKSAG